MRRRRNRNLGSLRLTTPPNDLHFLFATIVERRPSALHRDPHSSYPAEGDDMGDSMRGSVSFQGALRIGALLILTATAAQAADRPFYRQAQNAFYNLPVRDRNEAFLELMATGDFVAMASSDFSPRLYDATAQFQNMHGLQPSGVLTPETRYALSAVGGGIFNSWGLEFLDHPFADAAVVVPGRTGLEQTSTGHGIALENRRHTMSVAFAFFGDGESTLQSVFDNLTRPAPGRDVAMQVLKPEFLAVAGTNGGMRNYSRYIPVTGGIAGFTLSWNPNAFPNADRIAVVMANELYSRRMVGGDMFARLPGDASPISPGADDGSVQRQREAQQEGQRQAQQQAEQERQQAQQRYFDQLRQQQEEAENKKRLQDETRRAAEERARIAREAEDARRAKAEADRRVAQEQIRAAHLATAKAASDDTLRDAADFIKANRDDPQLMDHLQAIADLKTTAAGSDPDALDRGRSGLQARLKADPIYSAWEERQVAEHRRTEERDLRDTLTAMSVQKRFLIDQVAADPTGAYAGKLLGLVKEIDAVRAAPTLAPAQSLVGRIDTAIQDAHLGQRYAEARDDFRRQAGEGALQTETAVASPKP